MLKPSAEVAEERGSFAGLPIRRDLLQLTLLHERVSDLMRHAIVTMQLRPGQRVLERELVAWTGVSHATIRESIHQLAAEGLLTISPQKGAVVAEFTSRQVTELYEIRAVLEGLAMRQFVECATQADREALREAFEDVKAIVASKADAADVLDAKGRFYEVIFKGTRNSTLYDIVDGLRTRVTGLRATSISQPGRPKETVKEVARIVKAIEAGDADAAERASIEHVHSAMRVVLNALGPSEHRRSGAS